eukprot:48151_1
MALKQQKPQRNTSCSKNDIHLTASYYCRLYGGSNLYNIYEHGLFDLISSFTFQNDINVIEILKKERAEATRSRNDQKKIEIDKLLFNIICCEPWNINEFPQNMYLDVKYRHNVNIELLRTILTDWRQSDERYNFRNEILEGIKNCLKIDNNRILNLIFLKFGNYNKLINFERNPRNYEIIPRNYEIIEYAAKSGSYNCCKLLFRDLDWSHKYRTRCFKCNMIIDFLQNTQTSNVFIFDEIMTEIIEYDLVSVAKRILINRWHKLSDKNIQFAKEKKLECYRLFEQRLYAFNYNKYTFNNGNVLDLSDEEWGNDDEWDDDELQDA